METSAAVARTNGSRSPQFVSWLTCYLFLLPSAALFVTMVALPVGFSAVLAFFDWHGKDMDWSKFRFVGLANFGELLGTHNFWLYFGNTLFLMLAIPAGIIIQLLVAMVMNTKLREVVVYRTAWFIPSVSSGVAVLLLWLWVFNPDAGLVNLMLSPFLRLLHIQPPLWLESDTFTGAKSAFMIIGLWSGAGGMGMIMYLAALQGIPRSLYEAAEIDGASWWSRFRHITWPMVSPTTFFMLITDVIGGFQAGFMNAYVLTQGGPNGMTTTLSYYIYQQAYQNWRMGYAAALAWFVFLFVAGFTIINWKLARRRVHYQ
jgi:multiple sugar transport system permease protein